MAKLDRAKLGDFDALVIGLLLMATYKSQVIVPDFGFYGREGHISLIREGRSIAGVNSLAELPPKLRQAVLLMKEGREWGDGRRRGHARHISIAVYRPAETIVQCLDRADQVLRDAVTGRLIDDLAEEFGAYWAQGEVLVDLPSDFEGDAKIHILPALQAADADHRAQLRQSQRFQPEAVFLSGLA